MSNKERMMNINKPIILIREETKKQLADIINNSGLPAFIIEPILTEFLNETRIAAQKQYEIEKTQYEQALRTEQECCLSTKTKIES